MNDKTKDLSQQDSEELLVTSTSSSITVEPIVSLSENETTESDASTTTGVCQIVTSSTGSNSKFASVSNEDDSVASIEDRLTEGRADFKDDSGSPTMGGTSSNNDAETCVLPTSSNYIEQSKDNTKNMVITRSAGNSTEYNNMRPDVLVNPTTSSAPIISAPTTRSKRKLMNETAGPTALSRNNSISLNNKNLKVEVKNHHSPMTTRKSSTVSINSLQNLGDKGKNEDKPGPAGKSPSTTGKHQTVKVYSNDDDASSSSNTCSNKIVIKKSNCINDVVSNDKVEESHSDNNDTATCTISSAAGDNEESDSTRTKILVVSSCDNDDKNLTAGENRKVEPLKIKLNRDFFKTKITIKPIIKPSNFDSEGTGSPIPKLTIKPSSNLNIASTSGDTKTTANGSEQLHIEPHIVPKLTIRASDCNSSLTNADVKHSVVPKLTIKMDGVINCVKEPLLLNSSSSSASPSPPPLPKLTIKTSGDIAESIISTQSPSSQCHIVSTSTLSPSHSSIQALTVPKVTIKPIPRPSTSNGSETVPIPKLTIKPIPPTTTDSSCNESDCTVEAEVLQQTPVPKLTIRTGIEPSVKIQHNEFSNTIPKLTIRTIQEQGNDHAEKLQTIPKFTIKSVQDNTQFIPKLTIAVNDSSSSGSCNSPTNEKIPKLTIRQIEQSSLDETDRIPKLMISSIQDKEDIEKVPKLTIKQIQDVDVVDKVPKITIKPISEPDDSEKIRKITIMSILDSGESNEKVPKLTIRQIQETEDGEKVPKLKVTAVQDCESSLSVPKLMIKQIQEDDERVPKLTIISKSVCDETAKVRKLKIKPVLDSTATKTVAQELDTIDRIPKLEVKTSEPLDGEKIPKLTIRHIHESETEGKIPRLTIVQSTSTFHNEAESESESPHRTPERNFESCEDEKPPPNKLLRLSSKNDFQNSSAGSNTFRKEKEEREKEKNSSTGSNTFRKEKEKEKEERDKETVLVDKKRTEVNLNLEEEAKKEEQKTDIIEKNDESEEERKKVNIEEQLVKESSKEEDLKKTTDFEKESDLLREFETEEDIGTKSGTIRETAEVTVLETIDLESEPETTNEEEEQKTDIDEQNEGPSYNKEHKSQIKNIGNESEMPDIIDLDQDPEVIYVEQDSLDPQPLSLEPSQNEKIDDDPHASSMPCNIPFESTSNVENAKLLITESVDLTTPSPGSSPVYNNSNQVLSNEIISEGQIKTKLDSIESIDNSSKCLKNTDVGQEDTSEGEKIFEINCAPISTELSQSPKIFSEQIVIENSEDISMPSQEQLGNSGDSSQQSLFREEQSKSTENSNEPAHLDEKFLSNVDVLSCLGICQGNVNSSSFNIVDSDDILRRNNNKEAMTTAAKKTAASDENVIDEFSQSNNKLKRTADASESSDVEVNICLYY